MTTAPTSLNHRHTPHPLVLTLFAVLLGAAITVGIVLLVRGNDVSSTGPVRGSGTQAIQGRTVAPFTPSISPAPTT